MKWTLLLTTWKAGFKASISMTGFEQHLQTDAYEVYQDFEQQTVFAGDFYGRGPQTFGNAPVNDK